MSFHQFYGHDYMDRHPAGMCRLLHLLGLPAGALLLAAIVWLRIWWLLVLVPMPSYFFAWLGHVAVHNRPTAFEHPLWSLRGYWRMVGFMVIGRIGILRRNSRTQEPRTK